MTSLEIWIYENDRPLRRYGALSLSAVAAALAQGRDLLKEAMERAVAEVQAEAVPA